MHLATLLFPDIPQIRVHDVLHQDHTLVIFATTRGPVRCPRCRRRTPHLHSHYEKRLDDVACAGCAVTLALRVRRFRCANARCPCRIFGERLPHLVAHRARRTVRAQTQLLQQALALGARPGVRAAKRLGLSVSVRTLLRLLRRQPLPPVGSVRILGVDDFAFRKGRRYGTILIDIEQHRVLDLLPDRTAATLATWVRGHPEVVVICRDRAGPYAEGARQGAPQAQQAADRWHLLHNLWEAVERFLRHQHRALRAASQPVPEPATPTLPGADGNGDTGELVPPPPLTRTGREQAATRARRLAQTAEIQTLAAHGLPIATIARRLGLTRPTVRRRLQEAGGEEPDPAPQGGGGLLAPFVDYLWQRWQEGCHNAQTLYAELRARGYRGSYPHLRHALTGWRTPGAGARGAALQETAAPTPAAAYTPREATGLLLQDPVTLTTAEQTFLARLREVCPQVGVVQRLALGFQELVRTKDGAGLGAWVAAVEESGGAELGSFARGLRRDWSAVQAGLTLPWSNGMCEGFVNKVKMYKRAMFGRAKLDLLRLRVVLAA